MSGVTHRRLAASTFVCVGSVISLPTDVSASGTLWSLVMVVMNQSLLFALALLGTSVPDLDLLLLPRYPWIGRLAPHRGPTHSFAGLGFVGVPLLAGSLAIVRLAAPSPFSSVG